MIFAKKKIVLNSAQGNNKHGIAEITRLDNLTSLNIKLNNFQTSAQCDYIFLLKNNNLQQKINLADPCDFSCDIDIPIDLEKKISCLLIENGEKQIPIFWGGTATQTQVMALLNEESPQQKLHLGNYENSSVYTNSDTTTNLCNAHNTNNINPSPNVSTHSANNFAHSQNTFTPDESFTDYSQNKHITRGNDALYSQNKDYTNRDNITHSSSANTLNANSVAYTTNASTQYPNNATDLQNANNFYTSNANNLHNANNLNATFNNFNQSNAPQDNAPQQCNYCANNNTGEERENNNILPQERPTTSADFSQDDIEDVVDAEIIKYELIKNYDEPDFPHCQNCKYKNLFYQEKQLNEVKQELKNIAEIQQNEQENVQNMQVSRQNNADNCEFLQDSITNNNDLINEINDNYLDNDKTVPQPDDLYYYKLIKTQYDDMFEKYPPFATLSNIIENSKWIEVNGVDCPYIMGIIYENNQPKYLCYGIIQDKKQNPPVEIADSSQWVPFDIANEFGKGVWIMYQSAENGETIKVEVIV